MPNNKPNPVRAGKTLIAYGLLLLITFVTLLPFILTISGSFKTNAEILAWPPTIIPKQFTLQNYVDVWTSSPLFPRWIGNSVLVTTIHVLTELFFASLAAYAFARIRFPGRDLIFVLTLGTLMIPNQVTMISKYIILNGLGWVDTYLGVVAPTTVTVFGVFLMTQFMKALPADLEEAATIDGCGKFTIYWRIMLPLSKPALSALAIFAFKDQWNEFLWSLIVLNTPEMFTLPIGLNYFSNEIYTFWNLVLTGAMFNIIPIMIIFIIFQRYFIEGMSFSGLKG